LARQTATLDAVNYACNSENNLPSIAIANCKSASTNNQYAWPLSVVALGAVAFAPKNEPALAG
jgi:hypothetical protein